MWNGLVTDELNELFQQYAEQHNGIEPMKKLVMRSSWDISERAWRPEKNSLM
mgnify:CR=1 FL=1